MKTVKKLIITTALALTLNPTAKIVAMDMDNIDEEENSDASEATPLTPEQALEVLRLAQFCAKRAEYIVPLLSSLVPIRGITNIVFDYTKPLPHEIAQANHHLLEAAKTNDTLKAITALHEGADINIIDPQDKWERTPLLLATLNKQFEMANVLIDNNADINRISKIDKETALHYTIRNDTNNNAQIELVKKLIELNAALDIANAAEDTPLAIAIEYNQADMVTLLIAAGANPDRESFFRETAWEYAGSNPEILQAMRKGLEIKSAQSLSNSLNTLKEYLPKQTIVALIDDYAVLTLEYQHELKKQQEKAQADVNRPRTASDLAYSLNKNQEYQAAINDGTQQCINQ